MSLEDATIGAQEAYDCLAEVLQSVKYDSKERSHLIGIGIASQTLEIADCMFALSGHESDAAQFPLLRTLMEMSVNFQLLCIDPEHHVKTIELTDIVERLKALSRTAQVGDTQLVTDTRAKLIQRENELKNDGSKTINMYEKLKIVGDIELYSCYRLCSSFTHGQLAAVLFNAVTTESGSATVVFGKKLSEDACRYLWGTVALFLNGVSGSISKLSVNVESDS